MNEHDEQRSALHSVPTPFGSLRCLHVHRGRGLKRVTVATKSGEEFDADVTDDVLKSFAREAADETRSSVYGEHVVRDDTNESAAVSVYTD